MEKFKMYVSVACTSFTILMLIFTVLSLFDITGTVNAIAVLVLMAMTMIIAVALFFTDKIPVSTQLARSAMDMAVILAVVLGLGSAFGVVPLTSDAIAVAVAMSAAVYAGTVLIMMIKTKSDVDEINRTIRNIRDMGKMKGKNDGKDD